MVGLMWDRRTDEQADIQNLGCAKESGREMKTGTGGSKCSLLNVGRILFFVSFPNTNTSNH